MATPERIAYLSAYAQELQEYSMRSVTACERAKANDPWTPDEVEILLDPELTLREKIDELQRTYFSICQAGVRFRRMAVAA